MALQGHARFDGDGAGLARAEGFDCGGDDGGCGFGALGEVKVTFTD